MSESRPLQEKSTEQNAKLKFPLPLLPSSWRPYAELIRLEKPTGTKLMFWPFAWGLTLAAYSVDLDVYSYGKGLFYSLVGACIIRSSACTINDIFDRGFDAGVERTRNRPLPSGRVSVLSATLYLVIQYMIGIMFFYKTMTGLGLYFALFQLLPLFWIYPLLKRVTYWPQAWLGICMNFGFVTAWISCTSVLDYHLLVTAMTGCWCWTMLYDTIYACQDIKDDLKVGVRSTAILFGSWIKPLLVSFGIVLVSMLAYVGYLNGQSAIYFVVSVGGVATHLVWQFFTVDLGNPASCWKNFESNGQLGWIVWGGAVLDYLFKLKVLV